MNRIAHIILFLALVAAVAMGSACDPSGSGYGPLGSADADAVQQQPDATAGTPDATDGTPDAGPGATGQCAGAEEVPAAGLAVSGEDFYGDFADAFHFDESSCEQVKLIADHHVEKVFEVRLAAGQTVGMCQRGTVTTVNYIVDDCSGGQDLTCEASSNDSNPCLTYTAQAAETVFAVVEAYFDGSPDSAYAIELGLDPTCGDGAREAGEECDDGNSADGDGCSACAIDYGYVCHLVNGGSACFEAGCGDGILVEAGVGNEECDDNNTVDGDGCDAQCDVEDGYNCGAFPGDDACWAAPAYDVAAGSPVDATWPGILLTRYHDGTVTFANDVLFSGSVSGVAKEDGGAAEMNFQLVPDTGGTILINTDAGVWSDVAVPAGTYRWSVRPWGGTAATYSYHFEAN